MRCYLKNAYEVQNRTVLNWIAQNQTMWNQPGRASQNHQGRHVDF